MSHSPKKFLYLPHWQKSIITRDATLQDALGAISQSASFMACICDDGVLVGILTDSDIRRALLLQAELDANIMNYAQLNPITARSDAQYEDLIQICDEFGVREVPLVDSAGRLQDIFIRVIHEKKLLVEEDQETTLNFTALPQALLIFAGGLGSRLKTVLPNKPKPLAMVGDKPILERILLQAHRSGIRKFYIAVNYLSEQIEEFLAEPRFRHLDIEYVREQQRLGTAGALGLVAQKVSEPLVVTNADVLSTINYASLIRHHLDTQAEITVAVRPHRVKIPYGVVVAEGDQVAKIVEKPEYTYLVNAGIYVIAPERVKKVTGTHYLDMTELIHGAILERKKIVPFLMHEYWIDIGQPQDLSRANEEYAKIFEG